VQAGWRIAKAGLLVYKGIGDQVTEVQMDRDLALKQLVEAALPHVVSNAALTAAITESGVAPGLAHALLPRGGVDLALAYHRLGDDALRATLAATDLTAMRFREKVAHAVRLRLETADREAVRRGTALFALPTHASDGARAIWGTSDTIWTALGDTSTDVNWYSKRATLSAVYASTVLYWLGDESEGHAATWEFLDRRIGNVMSFEKAKAAFRENPIGKALLAGPFKVFERIHAPQQANDLPGRT
jgi:ubiquinone biosynthesis protein COQ9